MGVGMGRCQRNCDGNETVRKGGAGVLALLHCAVQLCRDPDSPCYGGAERGTICYYTLVDQMLQPLYRSR